MSWLAAAGYIALTALLAYLIGSIPTGSLVVKKLKGIDIREVGSGKTGATNVYRAAGPGAATLTLAGDVAKGVASVLLARAIVSIFSDTSTLPFAETAGALAAVAGHNWPLMRHGRGGRGVATSLGAAIIVSPVAAIVAFPLAVLTIVVSDMASAGSLAGTMVWLIVFAFLMASGRQSTAYIVFAVVAAAILFFQHRDNIGRLARGEERKLGLRRKLTKSSAKPVT